MEDRLLALESRLDKALTTIEKHNFLLESLLVNREQHTEHHAFIKEMIKEKALSNALKQKVLTNLISGGAMVVSAAVVTAIWIYFKELVLAT